MHPWLVLSRCLYIYAHKGVHNAHEEEYTFFLFSFLKVLNKQVDANVCKIQLIDTCVAHTLPLLFVADNITNTWVELHLKTQHITFFFF